MSGGARPLYPAIILITAILLAGYSYIGGPAEGEDESTLAFLSGLWRPVLISIAIYALIRLLIAMGMSSMLRTLGDIGAGVSTWIGKLASWIVLPLILIIMFDVITRKIEYIKVWNSEITSTYGFSVSFILQDFQWHLHGVLLLMTFGFGYILNAHVRVDIFREMFARAGQVKIETFGLTILAIPFMLVMIGFSWDLFIASFLGWEGSESMVGLGWRWIIKSFLIWGFCVALLAALGTLIRCLLYTYGDVEDQAIAEEKIQFFTDADAMPKLILEQNEDAANERGGN